MWLGIDIGTSGVKAVLIDDTGASAGQVLAPTKSVQYEVGGKVNVSGFDAVLSYFQISQPTAFAIPAPGGRQIFGLFGEQRNRGF